MSSVSKVSILGLSSKVLRTYTLGVKFEGDKRTKRTKEIEANKRVKGLQVRQEDMIYNTKTINTALNIARELPDKDSKFAPAVIQEHTKNYANIGNSAYYQLFIAAKGTIDREKKVSDIFQLLLKWKSQALEWIIFGRSPRVENILTFQWKIKRIYIINLLTSSRRQIDNFVPQEIHFNKSLPNLTEREIKSAFSKFYQKKCKELSLKKMTSKEKSFLEKLKLFDNNLDFISSNLHEWNNMEHKSRWQSLKKLSRGIAKTFGNESRRLFSPLRSIILFALSSKLEETVSKIIKNSDPKKCVSPPFKTKKKGRLPIILLMKKDYVIVRPGNAKQMTELVQRDGSFELGFPLKGYSRINGNLVFPRKVKEYIRNGAKIKLLKIQHGKAPSYKICVSVVLEGSNSMFISHKLTKKLLKPIRTNSSSVLGLDINRLSDYILAFSNQIRIPKEIKILIRKYNHLNSRIIPQLSYALKNKGRDKNSHDYCKLKGELDRVYSKRKKILSEIKNLLPHLIAAVLIKSGSCYLCIENLDFDPRGKKGALGKAFYSMPDEIDIFEKAILIATKISGRIIRLIKVPPQGTSTYHFQCRGILDRTNHYYDKALCKKCGDYVDTHHNAARNIKDKGEQLLQSLNRPSSHARVTE